MKRVLTALLLVPIFLVVILWAPPDPPQKWLFPAVTAFVAVLGFRAYTNIGALHPIAKPVLFGYVAGLLLLLLPDKDPAFFVLIAILAMALALRSRDLAEGLPYAAALLLGVAYVFGTLRCGVQLRAISPYWLFFALSLNWVGDIAALYVGRLLGRHKLAPNVSPAKSWEGSIDSPMSSVIYAAFYCRWLM